MSDRRMSAFPVPNRCRGAWVLLAVALAVSGCAGTIDAIPAAVGGLPADAPARPAETPAFPHVHDTPPPRPEPLDAAQQKKLEADLIAARDRQQPKKGKASAAEKANAQAAKAKQQAKRAAKGQPALTAEPPAATGQATREAAPWPVPR